MRPFTTWACALLCAVAGLAGALAGQGPLALAWASCGLSWAVLALERSNRGD